MFGASDFVFLFIGVAYHQVLFDSVPVSRLPDLILSVKKEAAEKNILAPMGGHIGDGSSSFYHHSYR
jgi:hypothetical protein